MAGLILATAMPVAEAVWIPAAAIVFARTTRARATAWTRT
jgi:hypothetical protein